VPGPEVQRRSAGLRSNDVVASQAREAARPAGVALERCDERAGLDVPAPAGVCVHPACILWGVMHLLQSTEGVTNKG